MSYVSLLRCLPILPLFSLVACEQVATSSSPAIEAAFSGTNSSRLSREQIRSLYSQASCPTVGGAPATDGSQGKGLRAKARTTLQAPETLNDAQRTEWSATLDRYLQADAETLPNTLYFNQLNVPTREFTLGFPLLGGGLIVGRSGAPVVEFFRLDFEARLGLGGKTPGAYEIALLADDGVRLKLDGTTYVEHPVQSGSRLTCGAQPIQLNANQQARFELEYFQGPRENIALVALWRPAGSAPETLCGYEDWKGWFDTSTVPSTPHARYQELLTRGWEVIPPEAFSLPVDEQDTNPCTDPSIRDEFETNPI